MRTTIGSERARAPGDRVAASRGDRTRRAIIAAARARFAAYGFEDTTLADVAADASVSGPTVPFHFGSKAGLLTAVINNYYDELMARVDEVIDKPTSVADRLTAFTRFWLREHEGAFDLYSVFASQGGWRALESPSGRALHDNTRRLSRVFERLIDDLKAEGMLRSDVPTRLVRDMFFGTAEYVLRGSIYRTGPLDHDRAADEILDLVLRGAGETRPTIDRDPTRLESIEQKLDRLLAQVGDSPAQGRRTRLPTRAGSES
ncbi:MAG: hypothetical protein AMXMBFR46_29010 [Acidimicrobiia bacterium]